MGAPDAKTISFLTNGCAKPLIRPARAAKTAACPGAMRRLSIKAGKGLPTVRCDAT